jgi:alpha-beta hydrolase superfamily lysophospholipase
MKTLALPLFAVLLLAGGCGPTVAAMGPSVAPPMLNGDHILTADEAKLPLRIWKPDGAPTAVLLALHGFNDYSNSFEEPGKFWATRGIVTYAYDQRGFGEAPDHGLWAGTETLVEDLRTAARLIRERHPGIPVYLVGESMGGAIALTALGTDDPPPADGVVLAAPAVRGWRALPPERRADLRSLCHALGHRHRERLQGAAVGQYRNAARVGPRPAGHKGVPVRHPAWLGHGYGRRAGGRTPPARAGAVAVRQDGGSGPAQRP